MATVLLTLLSAAVCLVALPGCETGSDGGGSAGSAHGRSAHSRWLSESDDDSDEETAARNGNSGTYGGSRSVSPNSHYGAPAYNGGSVPYAPYAPTVPEVPPSTTASDPHDGGALGGNPSVAPTGGGGTNDGGSLGGSPSRK